MPKLPKDNGPDNITECPTTLIDLFKRECTHRAGEIDPGQNHDWLGLTVGWAIAKGLNPAEANRFAAYVRYRTDLG